MKCSKSVRQLWRNARLGRVTFANGRDLTDGLTLAFDLLGTKRVLDWPVDATGVFGDLHSLATIAHYLDCPYWRGRDFDPRKMIGKLCCIKVQSVTEDGKQRLEIVGFAFYLGSLMHAESGRLVGSVRL